MGIKVLTLVENSVTASPIPLLAEHGLSFLIEADNRKILFDTGQGLTILNNADSLGVDLSKVDTVILSHGHYDHSKGLKKLIERNTNFSLIGHPDIFDNKLIGLGGGYFPIGISENKDWFEQKGIKIILDNKSVEITPKIRTTGEIKMGTDFEEVEPMFFIGKQNEKIKDTMTDDKALIIDTEKGIVVIFGCAHRGPINTLNNVAEITGSKKIYAIMGGMHLLFSDENKLKKIFKSLKEFGIEKMIIGHCTGFGATAALVNEFGNKVMPNVVGNFIEF
ncbi:MAG: MBL fold metallo-hydrolase [Desulfobacterales bacterium]|nr:MBL fold metallo-hydrolase [Desulfobacterales bacterium]MBF0397518.1 MBL fold metallo-hydrolase [Desulfobacterales bacterium]